MSIFSITFKRFTLPLLALSLLLATNLAGQDLQPSKSPYEGPSNAPPAAAKESRSIPAEHLLIQADSGAVFLGFLTVPTSSNVILEYSSDLRTWRVDVPVMGLRVPPPPPVSLIDRLRRSPGQNLRILPLDPRGSSEGYFRSKVMTATNVPLTSSGAANRAVLAKP